MAAQHKKELLVSTGVVLVVLVNDPIARGARSPSSHSEGRDAQVMPDWPIVTACIAEFLDLVQMRNRVISHGLVLPSPRPPEALNLTHVTTALRQSLDEGDVMWLHAGRDCGYCDPQPPRSDWLSQQLVSSQRTQRPHHPATRRSVGMIRFLIIRSVCP
jgi:hypothetical protein